MSSLALHPGLRAPQLRSLRGALGACRGFRSARPQLQPRLLVTRRAAGSASQPEAVVLVDEDEIPEPKDVAKEAESNPRAVAWKIITFLAPAACIPLFEPWQNLLETMVISTFSSEKILELACLGPASAVTSFNMYAFASLSVAALIACSKAMKNGDTVKGSELLSSAQALGLIVGVIIGGAVIVGIESLLVSLGVHSQLIPTAAAYLQIRAVGFPIQIWNSVTVSGLLAQQSVLQGLAAVMASLAVLALGELTLVGFLGWGLQGSGIAIVFAQIIQAAALNYALKRKGILMPKLSSAKLGDIAALAKALGLLGVVYIMKNLSYIVMASAAAALMPTQASAHQILYSFWNTCAFLMTSSEQAFYSFIPQAQTAREEFGLLRVLMVTACGVACISMTLCASFGFFGVKYMVAEAAIHPIVHSMTPFAMLALVGCCLDVMGTGMLLSKDRVLRVVVNFILVFLATTGMVTLGKALNWGILTIWAAVAVFFLLRGFLAFPSMMFLYYWPLQKEVEASKLAEAKLAAARDQGNGSGAATAQA